MENVMLPFVDFVLGDAVDEQEGIPVRQNALDRRVIERKRQVHLGCHYTYPWI